MTTLSGLPDDAPALVLAAPGDCRVERRVVPAPSAGEVLIDVHFSGVSIGTELWGATGKVDIWGSPPFVPGYQAVGQVVGVGGDGADGLRLGDYVASFVIGSHRRYVLADSEYTHVLAVTDHLQRAAIFVPAGVGSNALNMAGVGAGDSVLIIGQGLIGQATALLARLLGAYVIGTDVSPERLALSAAHCVDWSIDSSDGALSATIGERFPNGVDVVIESTGFTALVDEAMTCAREGGRFVFEGYYPDGLHFDFVNPHQKQLTAFFPCFVGDAPAREGILRLISEGAVDLEPLITHEVSWRDSAELYAQLFSHERDHINGIVFDWRDAE
jgi:2-desacetyl-2-hydroxyethyl bacteriochlorophyllide A dehydrogenase